MNQALTMNPICVILARESLIILIINQ